MMNKDMLMELKPYEMIKTPKQIIATFDRAPKGGRPDGKLTHTEITMHRGGYHLLAHLVQKAGKEAHETVRKALKSKRARTSFDAAMEGVGGTSSTIKPIAKLSFEASLNSGKHQIQDVPFVTRAGSTKYADSPSIKITRGTELTLAGQGDTLQVALSKPVKIRGFEEMAKVMYGYLGGLGAAAYDMEIVFEGVTLEFSESGKAKITDVVGTLSRNKSVVLGSWGGRRVDDLSDYLEGSSGVRPKATLAMDGETICLALELILETFALSFDNIEVPTADGETLTASGDMKGNATEEGMSFDRQLRVNDEQGKPVTDLDTGRNNKLSWKAIRGFVDQQRGVSDARAFLSDLSTLLKPRKKRVAKAA